MAGGTRLRPGENARLLAVLAIVLVLHALAIDWLAQQLEATSLLHPLPSPMFTRLLRPTTPPPVSAAGAPGMRAVRPRHPAITSIADSQAKPPARAASKPARKRAADDERVARAASPAASAPEDVAPAPSPAPAATEIAAPAASAVASDPPSAASAPASAAVAAASAASSAASAAAAATPPNLDTWPADTRLDYRLGGHFRSGDLHGSARVQWQREGERYQTRVDIDITLLASLVLTSQGEVSADGLYPRAYEELRRAGPRTARLGEQSITLSDGRIVPRPPGVQDTASQFVELSHRFSTGQDALEVGRTVSFWMARPGGVDLWIYDIVDADILQLPELGPVLAFHLRPRPIPNPRGNIVAEMWFAPSLQYLPVRIRVTVSEDTYVDLMVDKIGQR
jgi:hypothetical protein